MNHKANRSGRAVDWFIICSLKNTTLMVSCQGTILLCCHDNLSLRMLCMAQHFQLLHYTHTHTHTSGRHTHTHFHIADECLEVSSSCDRTWNIPSHSARHTNRHNDKAPRLFCSLFPFKTPHVRLLDSSVGGWGGGQKPTEVLTPFSHSSDNLKKIGRFTPESAVCVSFPTNSHQCLCMFLIRLCPSIDRCCMRMLRSNDTLQVRISSKKNVCSTCYQKHWSAIQFWGCTSNSVLIYNNYSNSIDLN